MKNYILHLENPAQSWENAFPVGNGSCGMMIHGGVSIDKLTLNEESIWSGNPIEHNLDGMPKKIAHVRRLFLKDKPYEANEWITENIGEYKCVKSYEYAGELSVSLHGDDACEDYRRDINLMSGICTVSYIKDGTAYKREYFASMTNGLLCAKYSADNGFSAEISFKRENTVSTAVTPREIRTVARVAAGGHEFAVDTKVVTDGVSTAEDGRLSVANATYIEIYTAICTSFKSKSFIDDAAAMISAPLTSWDTLVAKSAEEFASYMTRSDIVFDGGNPTLDAMPIDKRLARLADDETATDPGIISLYWQFGKYLLVASSCKCAMLPANLQGLWADGLESPWNSDYHTNINLQMNYWHAEEANISECTEPLFRYMNDFLLPGGKNAAKGIYGTRGMVAHHLSDIYGFAAIADGPWGLWPVGGAWLAYHMWEHYLYTHDTEFLRNTAYKYIREATLFFIDNLFEGDDGFLHTGPSTSPENRYFVDVNGEKKSAYIAISPTMDIEIVSGLLDFYVETEKILGIDPECAKIAEEKRQKMPPLHIGKHGQLMEWLYDYDEVEPGHRHISHSFGLYPAAQITRNTPELYRAIEVTLNRRLEAGKDGYGCNRVGWSRAWLSNLFSRLRCGEKAYENIRALIAFSTLPNFLDIYPASRPLFQIDGNFGGAAAIGEMVMQSHEGVLSLIPALPTELKCGSFTGLRARGGLTVSAEWRDGKITRFELTPDSPRDITVEFENGERMTVYADGKTVFSR